MGRPLEALADIEGSRSSLTAVCCAVSGRTPAQGEWPPQESGSGAVHPGPALPSVPWEEA